MVAFVISPFNIHCDTYLNRLGEVILTSTNNVCFCGKLEKIILEISSKTSP